MSGYAVMIDLSSYRAVAGPFPSEGDEPGSTYPDYEIETYLDLKDGPPPTPIPLPPTGEQSNAQRDRLLTMAALRIAPLQDAVDLDLATAEDIAMLKKWKKYRVDVNRTTEQSGWPHEVSWPVEPA